MFKTITSVIFSSLLLLMLCTSVFASGTIFAPNASPEENAAFATVLAQATAAATAASTNASNITSGIFTQPVSSYFLEGVKYGVSQFYGVVNSAQTMTCSVNGSFTSLTCPSVADFVAGNQIMIRGAAPPATITAPSAPSIVNICQGTGTNCTGGTPGAGGQTASIGYEIRAWDINGSSVISTAATSSTGWSSLYPNGLGGQAEKLQWTAVSNGKAYGVYKLIRGIYQLIDIITPGSTYGTSTITWYDWGNYVPRFGSPYPWAGLYPDSSSAVDSGDVLATISSIVGTTVNLTSISPTMTSTSTNLTVRHDTTTALQGLFNESYPNGGASIKLPNGTYNIHYYEPASTSIINGLGLYINQDNFTLSSAGGWQNTTITPDSALWGDQALLGNAMTLTVDGRQKSSSVGTLSYNYQWGSDNNLCPAGAIQCSGGAVGTNCSNCSGGIATSNFLGRPLQASASQGAKTIQLSTNDATALNDGNKHDILIRTGDMGQNQPDSEYNVINSVDTSTGLAQLSYPLGKGYVQECYNSGAAGRTSQNCSALTNAPFGIEVVDTATIHKDSITDLTINSLPYNYTFLSAQFADMTIEKIHGSGGNIDASGNGRKLLVLAPTYTTVDMGAELFPMDTKGGDFIVADGNYSGVEPIVNQVTEGAFDYQFINNVVNAAPLTMTQSNFSTITNNGEFSDTIRGYMNKFVGNHFINCGSSQFLYMGSQDLFTVMDGSTQGGTITGNTMVGGGQPNAPAPQCFQTFGDNWQTDGNACASPVLPGTNWGQTNGTIHTLSAMLTVPTTGQPSFGLGTLTQTIGTLPQWSYVTNIIVYVSTAFNSGGATDAITVGVSGATNDLVSSTAVTTTGAKVVSIGDATSGFNHANVPISIYFTSSGSAPTTGRLMVGIQYTIVPQNFRGSSTSVPLVH